MKNCAAGVLLFIFTGNVTAQEVEYPASFAEAMPLYETALGPFTRPVTTSSAEAQAYFNQGIQFMFAFTPTDAAHAFREAQQRDPDCAMCLWGIALASGHSINGPMTDESGRRAFRAIGRAADRRECFHGEARSAYHVDPMQHSRW